MKKRFSDEQIVGFHREAATGVRTIGQLARETIVQNWDTHGVLTHCYWLRPEAFDDLSTGLKGGHLSCCVTIMM